MSADWFFNSGEDDITKTPKIVSLNLYKTDFSRNQFV